MSAAPSYIPPAEIGEVMRAPAAGRVIASRHPGFAPGDLVHGPFGVQEHAVSDGQNAYKIEVTGGRYRRRPKVVTPDTRTPRVIEPNLLDGTKAPPALAEGFRRVASRASNRDVVTSTPKTSL
jgi:hypothetical protein